MVEEVFERETLRDLEVKGLVRDDDDVHETGSMGTSSYPLEEAISRQKLQKKQRANKKEKRRS